MHGEKEIQRQLQSLLKGLQKFSAENDQWMSSHNSKSKRELQRKLQELKQGSMSVEEYFQEMELAMIRAGVKETSKATTDRFLNGLNPELACFATTLTFLDIDILVQFVAEYEQKIMRQRCSKSSSNSKEIESLIVTVPNELEPAKEEEEPNVENQAEKCEEDNLVLSTNLVIEEVPLIHEKKSENKSESDYCETFLERKIQFEKEKNIESMECCQNKENKNKCEELNEKKDEKSCEKSEVKSDCMDIVLVANGLNHYLPHDFLVLQECLDLIPKKPPDGFLSSRSIEHSPPSSDIEKHLGSLKFDILDNLLPLRCLKLHTLNFHGHMDFVVCRCSYMHVAACLDDTLIYSNNLDEHVNYLLCVYDVLRKKKLFSNLENSGSCMDEIVFLGFVHLLDQGKLDKRHTCWLKFIKTFPYIITYKKGKESVVDELLSRRYSVLSSLNTRLLGLEYTEEMYAIDIGLAELFLSCEIEHYASKVNKQRSYVLFEPGDWGHMIKEKISAQIKSKLAPSGYDPSQVLKRINDDAYKIDFAFEYSVIITFNVGDLCPFDPGGDSRTNLFEERGNDAIQNQQVVSSNSMLIELLIQEDIANQIAIGSTIVDKYAENVTNFIWAANGDTNQVLGLES